MDDAKIILENGIETSVKGIFYIFNSKYYFIYTTGEPVDNDYTQLYLSQVYKEIQNTQNGPVDTGFLMGVEISDSNEWSEVQKSVTKIVEDKKNNSTSDEIQYLPINMLVNLKVKSSNKFKLMTQLLNDLFNLNITVQQSSNVQPTTDVAQSEPIVESAPQEEAETLEVETTVPVAELSQQVGTMTPVVETPAQIETPSSNDEDNNVIIDYRAKFFEEQDKNRKLQDRISELEAKLSNIKTIIE